MKTLLVEDDDDCRDTLKRTLELRGYHVTACAEGEAALAAIQKTQFQLILLDLMLPKIDGLELCRRLRQMRDSESAVVLVCTARASPESLRHVLSAGADDYLEKPVDFDLLNIRLSVAESLVKQRAVRRQAEHKLHALAAELSVAEEEERRRFASELHDGVGQNLAWCKIRLCEMRANHPECTAELDEISTVIDRVITETRSLTFEISPPMLYEMGLEPALEWLTEHFQERYRLPCTFEYAGSPSELPIPLAVTLFQSARELLFNVVKHAKAKEANLKVSKAHGILTIEVSDDGVGFDLAATTGRIEKLSGFGIFSIRQRLRYLGGDLQIDSDKRRGTRVTMTIPVGRSSAKLRSIK
ncbi:MAG TPA: response regulator [Planctomycetota bacterium]|nr:response regulator [Planctomycetota bacterium]